MGQDEPGRGRLIVVGCGLQPSRHASARTISEIERADDVFVLAEPFAIDWVCGLHPQVRNLGIFYAEDRDRRETYAEMQHALLERVRAGRRVCAVFYGHPGVFAQVGRKAMASARAEGFEVRMEPGISAEACLYADLDLDPGEHGVQSFEATRFLIRQHTIDPGALLLLWQISQAGNIECVGFEADRGRLAVLVEKLSRWYPAGTPAILYEAANLPIQDFRAEHITLAELPDARLSTITTLVIPPAVDVARDRIALDALASLGRDPATAPAARAGKRK